MTEKQRRRLLAVITVLALGGSLGYGVHAFIGYQGRLNAPSAVAVQTGPAADPGSWAGTGERVLFRNTAAGAGYGMVASVPLADPGGARQVSARPCDRVYAVAGLLSCLHTDAGILTTFGADIYDGTGRDLMSWPLPGVPSRTRISPDGRLVATTAFVTGHSYAQTGFSTETTIKEPGTDYGNLEQFAVSVDGKPLTAADRNIWGVTFTDDGDTFYATAASGGRSWLMQGSLRARTLTAVRATAECPSVSPDGTRVAYKKNRADGPLVHWDVAVLDLATGTERVIPLQDGIDDQLEWLDQDTLLFGRPRPGSVGDSDIFALDAAAGAVPRLFIEHAWSPSVIREP